MIPLKVIIEHLLILLSIWIIHPTFGQDRAQMDRNLAKYLDIQSKRIQFNGVVLVTGPDGTLSEHAIGLASRELQVPMSADAKFKVASITKSFTGLLLTMAEREQRLSLDDQLQRYFPDLPNDAWNRITIGQLLSHTSGIPHWSGYADYWTTKAWLPLRQKDVLKDIFQMKLLFEPGTKVNYSSPAYYLLATILEQVYQKSYRHILTEKVLSRLDLKQTTTYDGATITPKLAVGYHLVSDDSLIVAPPRSMSAMTGGGNLVSNAQELTRWSRSFLQNHIWQEFILKTTFTPVTKLQMPNKDNARYGRGWYLHPATGARPESYQTSGGTFGFSSKLMIYPKEQISIVILSNLSFLPMDAIGKDIEQIVFERPFEFPKLLTQTSELSLQQLQSLSGLYFAENGMKLQTILHNNKLYAKLGPNPPFEIHPQSEDRFFSQKVEVEFGFKRNAAGQVIGLEATRKGTTHYFAKK